MSSPSKTYLLPHEANGAASRHGYRRPAKSCFPLPATFFLASRLSPLASLGEGVSLVLQEDGDDRIVNSGNGLGLTR